MFYFNSLAFFVNSVKDETRQDSTFLDKYIAGRETFPSLNVKASSNSTELENKKGGCARKNKKKDNGLEEDKEYLLKLTAKMDETKGSQAMAMKISLQANQALEFINGRSTFWDQIDN